MARRIKINTFTFRIKRRNVDEFVGFDDFFVINTGRGQILRKPFEDFFKDYASSFDGKFVTKTTSNKAINLSSTAGRLSFASRARTVNGIYKGGSTGYKSTIQPQENAESEAFVVTTGHVNSHLYHFILWFPEDFDTGILIIQGYADSSIADIVKNHLSDFVRQQAPDFMLRFGRYVDQETVRRFAENAVVDKVILRRRKLDSNKAMHVTKLQQVDNGVINIDIIISGLKKLNGFTERVRQYMNGEEAELFEIEELTEYGIDGEHETVVQFDNEGQKASGNSANEFDLSPDLYIF